MTRTQLGSITRALLARLQYPEMCPGQNGILSAALDRIARGTYGICLVCHGEIGVARLAAVPHAGFCIPCQEEWESPTRSAEWLSNKWRHIANA